MISTIISILRIRGFVNILLVLARSECPWPHIWVRILCRSAWPPTCGPEATCRWTCRYGRGSAPRIYYRLSTWSRSARGSMRPEQTGCSYTRFHVALPGAHHCRASLRIFSLKISNQKSLAPVRLGSIVVTRHRYRAATKSLWQHHRQYDSAAPSPIVLSINITPRSSHPDSTISRMT
jgi:hypothetical protein